MGIIFPTRAVQYSHSRYFGTTKREKTCQKMRAVTIDCAYENHSRTKNIAGPTSKNGKYKGVVYLKRGLSGDRPERLRYTASCVASSQATQVNNHERASQERTTSYE